MSRLAGIISFTACALQASAFLLPPNVALSSEDRTALRLTSPVSTTNAVVQLPCSECAFSASRNDETVESTEDEPLFWVQGGAHSVLVNFTVSDDRQRLQANGETIYPLELLEVDVHGSPKIYVDQVRSGASVADIEAGTEKITPVQVTGHSIGVNQQGDELMIPIEYTVFELEHQPVSLGVITVNVLDLPEGLMIVSVESGAPAYTSPDDFFTPPTEDFDDFLFPRPPPELEEIEMHRPHSSGHKECNMLPAALCKLRNIIEAKLRGMGKGPGCHGRKGGKPHRGKLPTHIKGPHFRPGSDDREPPRHKGHHFRPEMDDEERPHRPHHHGRPHHMRPHHHGHHGHHFMHAFSRGLAAVLVPTMAGIAVGMTASLIGLIVGRLVGFIWFRVYRGGRRGYSSVALDDSTVNEMDAEKEVVGEEPLPMYESAPAYEEAVREKE